MSNCRRGHNLRLHATALAPGERACRKRLEAESPSKLPGKGLGNYNSGRTYEASRLLERRRADIASVGRTEVGAVRQVECLEEQLQPGPVSEVEIFGEAGVELDEILAAQVVVRNLHARIGCNAGGQLRRRICFCGRQVGRIGAEHDRVGRPDAAAVSEYIGDALGGIVWTACRPLHDRRDGDAPREADQAAERNPVPLVGRRGTEVVRREPVQKIRRAVSERSSIAVVSQGTRKNVC